ncbi:DNA-binding response regulator [Paenibacillus sp. VTT E-133280]|uniref:response regulator transcription factor n=1 Tax=Paenibacillus sp. VTT E-133280 TaxID=1986222 RepID=UPI000BA00052|nr:response regulator transcription factor [Paenibacillus sp. VTT E-133280]OZQ60276.1 DNA-binding response regulator [Paenibacillus sp. VTT E-133280]
MTTILIVEDDGLLNEGLKFMLEKENHKIIQAYSFQEAASRIQDQTIGLVLLDINLPDESGLILCREIRRTSSIPVIFLTANDTEQDMVAGFGLGADDYIAKPFSMAVLLQRVKAVLRRTGTDGGSELFHYKDITINSAKMKIYKYGQEIKLTTNEYRLLAILTENSGQVLTRRLMLEKLWDIDGNFVDENTLSVNIRRLRSKIEDDPKDCQYIKTVFGIGYTWGE